MSPMILFHESADNFFPVVEEERPNGPALVHALKESGHEAVLLIDTTDENGDRYFRVEGRERSLGLSFSIKFEDGEYSLSTWGKRLIPLESDCR